MNSLCGGDQSSCQVLVKEKGRKGGPAGHPGVRSPSTAAGPGRPFTCVPSTPTHRGPAQFRENGVSKRERSCRRSPEPEGESDSQ